VNPIAAEKTDEAPALQLVPVSPGLCFNLRNLTPHPQNCTKPYPRAHRSPPVRLSFRLVFMPLQRIHPGSPVAVCYRRVGRARFERKRPPQRSRIAMKPKNRMSIAKPAREKARQALEWRQWGKRPNDRAGKSAPVPIFLACKPMKSRTFIGNWVRLVNWQLASFRRGPAVALTRPRSRRSHTRLPASSASTIMKDHAKCRNAPFNRITGTAPRRTGSSAGWKLRMAALYLPAAAPVGGRNSPSVPRGSQGPCPARIDFRNVSACCAHKISGGYTTREFGTRIRSSRLSACAARRRTALASASPCPARWVKPWSAIAFAGAFAKRCASIWNG